MSAADRPLHVLVAEALGWTNISHADEAGGEPGEWWGNAPDAGLMQIPRYDVGWCSAGPLLERFGIDLEGGPGWSAYARSTTAHGNRPTEAIARLVVELHRKGLLKAT